VTVDFLPYLKRKLIRELITICSEVMTEWIAEDDQPRQLKNLNNHFEQLDLRAIKNLISDAEGLKNFINIQFTNGRVCLGCRNLTSRGLCKVWDESRSCWSSCSKFESREDGPEGPDSNRYA